MSRCQPVYFYKLADERPMPRRYTGYNYTGGGRVTIITHIVVVYSSLSAGVISRLEAPTVDNRNMMNTRL